MRHYKILKLATIIFPFLMSLSLFLSSGVLRALDREEYTIGLILPLSGEFSFFGVQAKRGALLAAKKLEEEKGLKLKLIFEDDACKAQRAVIAYNNLKTVKEVDFIIGPACTGSIMSLAPLVNRSRTPILALLDAGEEVEKSGPYVFSLGFSSEEEGYLIAEHIGKQGIEKVAIIYDSDKWATSVKEAFVKRATQHGIKVCAEERHLSSNFDYRSEILRVMKCNPQALYIAPAYNGGTILKQLAQLNIDLPVYGPDTFGIKEVIDVAGDAANGTVYANVSIEDNNVSALRLTSAYIERYKEQPSSFLFVSLAYDAILITANALLKGGNMEQQLYSTKGSEGYIGFLFFDQNGMAKLRPSIMRVENQQFVSW